MGARGGLKWSGRNCEATCGRPRASGGVSASELIKPLAGADARLLIVGY